MKRLLTILLFLPLAAFSQLNDTTIYQGEYQCFYNLNGTVYEMGGGAVGIGTNTGPKGTLIPVQFADGKTRKIIAGASGLHSAVLIDQGDSAWWAGLNDGCIAGNCSVASASKFTFIPKDSAGNDFRVTGVYASAAAGTIAQTAWYFFIRNDGTLWRIGYHGGGLAGNGSTGTYDDSLATPVAVTGSGNALLGKTITKICGVFFPEVMCSDGTVYTWGNGNAAGEILGRSGSYLWPGQVTVGGLSAIDIASNSDVSYVLTSNHHKWAWGFYSALAGIGTPWSSTTQINTPVDETSASGVGSKTFSSIAATEISSYAILSDSSVIAWGQNEEGSIGNGQQINMFTNSPPFEWDGTRGLLVVPTGFNPLPGLKIKRVYAGGYFVRYEIIQTYDGRFYAIGRNKNYPTGGRANGDVSTVQEGQYPDWNDDTVARQIDLSATAQYVGECPYCTLHPTATGCHSKYTPPGEAAPTVSAGSNFSTLSGLSPALSGSATPASGHTISAYHWSSTNPAVTFSNAFSKTATVNNLPVGSDTLVLWAVDDHDANASSSVVITVTSASPLIYVSSSTGSDANAGDSAHPFATIAKAVSTVSSGGEVKLLGGDVFNETMQLKTGVAYTTYGSGLAKISGFDTLTGGTSMGGGVYEFPAPVTAVTNLLVWNGQVMPMGRWPDTGYLSYTGITTHALTASTSGFTVNWAGAYMAIAEDFYIKADTALIATQTGTGFTFTKSLTSTSSGRGRGYFIFNDPRTLPLTIIPGRWYANWTKDSIEIYTPGGLGANQALVSIRDSLISGVGVSNVSVSNIEVDGANQAAVWLNGTDSITFTNCLFKYGGKNMFTGNNCPASNFVNCSWSQFENNGGYVTGLSSKYCQTVNCTGDSIGLWPGMGFGSGNGTAGYTGWSNLFGFNTWSGNKFTHIGYDGIAYSGDSNTLTNNVVDYFCMYEQDGGGYYTTDPSFQSYTYGSTLIGNFATHGMASPAGIYWDSTDAAMGFYPDGHSSHQTYIGNTAAFNASDGIFIHGSTIVDTSGDTYYGNGYCQACVSEFSGTPVTGVKLKNLVIGLTTTGQIGIGFITPNSISTMGLADKNALAGPLSTTTPFFTKSSSDAGTRRTLASWRTNTSNDANSTLQTGSLVFLYNPTGSTASYTPWTTVQDPLGNVQSAPISVGAYQSGLYLVWRLGYNVKHKAGKFFFN